MLGIAVGAVVGADEKPCETIDQPAGALYKGAAVGICVGGRGFILVSECNVMPYLLSSFSQDSLLRVGLLVGAAVVGCAVGGEGLSVGESVGATLNKRFCTASQPSVVDLRHPSSNSENVALLGDMPFACIVPITTIALSHWPRFRQSESNSAALTL